MGRKAAAMPVKGLLLDLEGVLYTGDVPITGADGTLERLRSAGFAIRFLTNTTTRPRAGIAARMNAIGLAADAADIFTPAAAAGLLLEKAGIARLHLAAVTELAEDFAGFELTSDRPEAVVMGDLYRGFDWDRLNRLFVMVRDGARLVALHKNRYCRRGEALALDLGPFVAAVEYAAGAEAELVGKPAPAFFQMALASLGFGPADVAMVGDDIEADIGGAQNAGLRAFQVRTGKFSPRDLEHPSVTPDARIGSIAELPDLLAAGLDRG